MPRSRNVWISFGSDPDVIRGGLNASDTITNAQFLALLRILFHAPGGFNACKEGSSLPVRQNDEVLPHGHYILSPTTPGQVLEVTNDRYYPRTLSRCSSCRDATFMRDVRRRDRGCMVTGAIAMDAEDDYWSGFEAAHIFPLALSELFSSFDFPTVIPNERGINAPNNGILLRADVHQLWDSYAIAVNPNDGFRIQSFRGSSHQYHNTVLQPACRHPEDPHRVIDALLTWHFKQAVLYNMRGAGEPSFEFDFPPGTDMVGLIREGPLPAERMEAELFGRLYGLT
ncbi:hypothetical protein MferCBS31731_006600 [Microsporum ferrugineum]